jgi:hypothetical protein
MSFGRVVIDDKGKNLGEMWIGFEGVEEGAEGLALVRSTPIENNNYNNRTSRV